MSVTRHRPALRLLCPAKINLHLRVGPRRRADGLHPLLSWMTTVGLFDTLEFAASELAPAVSTSGDTGAAGRDEAPTDRRGDAPRPAASAARPADVGVVAGSHASLVSSGSHDAPTAPTAAVPVPLTLACDPPGFPCDERNLVFRIAAAWAGQRDPASPRLVPLQGRLTKRIPAGAGLGGGSSDGARALQAVNRLWRTDRSADELSAFAARFGSDLPFFLFGPSSVCTGRGEVVRPIAPPRPRWAALVLPPVHMPTPDVYRRFDEMGLGREQDVADEPNWADWSQLNAARLLPRLVNDLEPAAFALRPDLGELREAVERRLGRPVRMSGSGSSLFTLFDAANEARDAAGALGELRRPMQSRIEAVEIAPQIEDDLAVSLAGGSR
jgi:4-diphosphocytidyl-2C-methyl-D-erythritol kinase